MIFVLTSPERRLKMFNWISDNLGTIIVALILLAIITAIITAMVKNKKSGKSVCSGNCASCPMSGGCKK